ncbi:TetR/AcrR family transcriptional regulator [Leptospira idonii]|uniref:TetR/AcrR family transcriptional regulator n=1 Tax=Leptospira idonii TaxID=1193500 RepID=A0A4R9M0U6_9LEPT|nr:TetR/AcrR family transcriptional regulator [Leptospira idonii]TGN19425.1 TetR/AcrR family transcriptional regulator [Leptospira idonii]
MKKTPGQTAQIQILEAVDRLFYQEGARAVGVDSVVKEAGVNKMALYRQFESKDGLLLHYLQRRDESFWERFEKSISKHPQDARKQLIQIFIDLSERTQNKTYRGCPFINIAVEFPDKKHPARNMVAENKSKLLKELTRLSKETGAKDYKTLAIGLGFLVEGAYAASQTYSEQTALFKSLPKVATSMIDSYLKK